jgi:hypothetical protein
MQVDFPQFKQVFLGTVLYQEVEKGGHSKTFGIVEWPAVISGD